MNLSSKKQRGDYIKKDQLKWLQKSCKLGSNCTSCASVWFVLEQYMWKRKVHSCGDHRV